LTKRKERKKKKGEGPRNCGAGRKERKALLGGGDDLTSRDKKKLKKKKGGAVGDADHERVKKKGESPSHNHKKRGVAGLQEWGGIGEKRGHHA